MNQFARIISSVFQPLLMPVYSILLLFVYTHFKLLFAHQFWTIMVPVILFSFAVPGILIYVVYKLKLISDLSLKIRKERFIPYSIVLISSGVVSYARLIFHCCYPHRHIHYHLVEDQRPHVRYRRFAGGGNVGKLLH